MGFILALASVALIFIILLDWFEAIVLPRRVTRPYRYARLFYRNSWMVWRSLARLFGPGKVRETFLSMFGPLSLLGLFASWILGLILAFGLLEWSLGLAVKGPDDQLDLGTYLYFSGVTFFTLGLGDVTPLSGLGRLLTVIEAGLGFGFLAVVIAYLPVLYQSFSQREVTISMLDARAGSPPSAGQLLIRARQSGSLAPLASFLEEWERWAAELLESHLSYPVLSYYRSQHDNQSWLAALTTMLDTCALLIALVKDSDVYRAQLTFAMARHAAVDLALVFWIRPHTTDRLSAEQFQRLRAALEEAGLVLRAGPASDAKVAELRAMYEPFVNGLSEQFLLKLPPFLPETATVDNWQTSAWQRRTPGIGKLPVLDGADEHFD
jgi:hypothetical protein